MRKLLTILGVSAAICIFSSMPVFAGMENREGALKYLKEDTGAYAVNEWVNLDGNWYYFGKDGNSCSGWVRLERKWYYLDPSTGIMKTGWFQNTDGNWYYLDDTTGEMLSKTRTPDGYYVEKNGKYNADKGNSNDDKKGPGANLAQEKLENVLKGVTFPKLEVFATANLETENWGIEGSVEAIQAFGVNQAQELASQGIEVTGDTTIYVNGTSITYATEGPEKPLLKLVKSGDHYELYDYENIDKNMEAPLLAMSSMISSVPQTIFNTIYTAAQYDQTIMSYLNYKTFGDSQIMYTIVGNHEYFYFSIKAK